MEELVEKRGEDGKWDRSWRGSKWPWKKMSSAGDKSSAREGGGGFVAVVEEWREIVKENSWEGEEDGEGEWEYFSPSIFCFSIMVEVVFKDWYYDVVSEILGIFFVVEIEIKEVVIFSLFYGCYVNKAFDK